MKFIVKLHPEITIKSKSVRKRFTRLVESNLKIVLRRLDEKTQVQNNWDNLSIYLPHIEDSRANEVIEAIAHVSGIIHFSQVLSFPYVDMDDIAQMTLGYWKEAVVGKTFCVRVKRTGKHDFTSTDVERYVGGCINQNVSTAQVKLSKPELTIRLEIKDDKLLLVTGTHRGLGGFPIPTQEDVLSLMSGGFDSGVASYQMIRRGARVHYCFFNLGGAAHEIGVKQVSHFLWKKFSSTHRVKFISVDFEPIVAEILETIDNGHMGVVLKRMMMRAASKVAEKMQIEALVTGESLGQVSSQTLTNLNVIDRVTDTLILRPLIHLDKQEIIDTARRIGTEDFARTMPEYCGVISKKPTVKAVLSKVEEEESKFDLSLIDQVVYDAKIMDIKTIEQEADAEVSEVEEHAKLETGALVIDIRSPEEEEEAPLELDDVEVIHIPFYKLSTQFGDLPQSDKPCYLYCDRGIMSKLQALLLHENGYKHVKVYRPQ